MQSEDQEPCLDDLFALFNLQDKRSIEKRFRTTAICHCDFVRFLEMALCGDTEPYRYARHFVDKVMPHLIPTDAERQAVLMNGPGPVLGPARKAFNKMIQQAKEHHHIRMHFFYTSNDMH